MPGFMGPHTCIKTQTDVPIPMRDGVRLYADIYRPDTEEKVPVLLQRTPYNKALAANRVMSLDAVRAASHGYAVVIQDTRGRFASEGEFYPFLNEPDDGYDTVEWCAAQPWSSGKVGMYGRSYVGATQWLAAIARPPSLAAIVPGITASDYYEGWTYQGGALAWGFILSWTLNRLALANLGAISRTQYIPPGAREALVQAIDHMDDSFLHLPLKSYPHLKGPLAPYFYDWISHPTSDAYWRRWRIEDHWPQLTIPALNLGGWHDIFLKGTCRNFVGMRKHGATPEARTGQRLLIGPWHHSTPFPEVSGEVYFGLAASQGAVDTDALHLRWFDYWLKGIDNGVQSDPPVRIFVMGANHWRDEQEWPLARTQYRDYYLHSGGRANTAGGDGLLSQQPPGQEPSDVYLYDPRHPVPTRGGGLCCGQAFVPGGAYNQQEIEARPDVLVYSTPPLESDAEITGPLALTLYAASSAPDTDFAAKLVDVSPCGCTRNLTDGILRARYRESTDTPKLIQPGQVYCYSIDLVATSNLFQKGHRIRLEISSSNFPRFDRNPNTGKEPWEETATVPAVQTIFHDPQHPSHLTLPIIPSG
jgi:putative CocE/NonD family hydrolase